MTPELLAKYDGRVPRYTSYPTAPHFHGGIGAETYGDWLGALHPSVDLSLYVHVPFCKRLCWFCGCHTRVVNRDAPVLAYLDLLELEIDRVADRLDAAGSGPRRTVNAHWGGGTPTILGPDGIRRLGERLRRRFAFTEDAEFAVEVDPRTLTREMVRAMADAGVNRASLGVQDVNPVVQEAINRVQPLEVTTRTVEWLHEAGIDAINIDLMYGLPLQTLDDIWTTVKAVAALDPDRLALFGYAHVPWMKQNQQMIREEDLPDGIERLAQFQLAGELLKAAGYQAIGLDHFAKPEDGLAVAQREGRLHRNFQGYTVDPADALIGFGTSAIGALPQGYIQNSAQAPEYRKAISDGHLAVVRGVTLDDEDRLRRNVIERLMCDLSVDLAAEAARMGMDPALFLDDVDSLAEMAEDGLVEIDGWRITVPAVARVLVRVAAAAFDHYLASGQGRHAKAV